MNISATTNASQAISESIVKLNDMLKNITTAQINMDDKLLKANVTAQVTGLGDNIDVSA